ncbi:MAG: hypothetical protein RSD88_04735 [Anaerovoracaceae bacterium]
MDKQIDIIVANPAGNTTIFVITPFPRDNYQEVAKQLLAMDQYQGEQVAFVLPPLKNAHGRMEMCGLEFCGNASRAFAIITANQLGLQGRQVLSLDVSGCADPLSVTIDTDTGYTKTSMPNPILVKTMTFDDILPMCKAQLVDLGGILHLVLFDVSANQATFDQFKELLMKKYNPAALGVLFYDQKKEFLTPVVYVKDVDTTYFEGSCASGALAVATAITERESEGIHTFTFKQPKGAVTVTITKKANQIESLYLEGPVTLSPTISVTISLV